MTGDAVLGHKNAVQMTLGGVRKASFVPKDEPSWAR